MKRACSSCYGTSARRTGLPPVGYPVTGARYIFLLMPSPVAVWSFWIAVCACAAGQIAILRDAVSLRGTSRPQSGTETDAAASPQSVPASGSLDADSERMAPHHGRAGRVHAAGEVMWAVLPGIALVFVLLWTWRAMHAGSTAPAPHAAVAALTATAR